MYQPGAGTWFSFTLTITRPQAVDVDFLYDTYPEDEMYPPSPQAFAQDFEAFPRDEAHTPDWLKAQLREGNRLLHGGYEQDVKDARHRFYDSLGQTGVIRPPDAAAWRQGPEQYFMIMPPDVSYGVVVSDGLSDPPSLGQRGQNEGYGREMYLASEGFAGGQAPAWLVDVLRGVCRQIVEDGQYGARFDVACPDAPAEWSTDGVVSVGVDVNVPTVPQQVELPNGYIQMIGVALLRPAETPSVRPDVRPDSAPFLDKLRALPPEQIASLSRPSLV
jgi:hypothetical protein